MTHNEYFNLKDRDLHIEFGFPSKIKGTPVLQSLAYTDGSLTGSKHWAGNEGIYRECNFTVTVDDAPYIYKLVSLDNRSEHLAYAIDTKLNLNLVPYVRPYVLSLEEIENAYFKTWGEKMPISDLTREFMLEQIALGGGAFMEFYPHGIKDVLEKNTATLNMLLTPEGRFEFIKLYMLDFLTSNRDSRRDVSNWLLSRNGEIVAVDNSLAGCTSMESFRGRLPEKNIPFEIAIKDIPCPEFFDTGLPYTYKDRPDTLPFAEAFKMFVQSTITKEYRIISEDIHLEAYKCFLRYFKPVDIFIITNILDWDFSWVKADIDTDMLTTKFINAIANRLCEELEGCLQFYHTCVLDNDKGGKVDERVLDDRP